ncbi:unnamed protein product [Moneuplotes crassus]|uniref:J domain-containing protein n=2 Tax=Euplotes crassus TaxID=5936 RepID=A0AAD1XYD0_EUPCR|nr:unnamed protein product [Moneuplotes crassus]
MKLKVDLSQYVKENKNISRFTNHSRAFSLDSRSKNSATKMNQRYQNRSNDKSKTSSLNRDLEGFERKDASNSPFNNQYDGVKVEARKNNSDLKRKSRRTRELKEEPEVGINSIGLNGSTSKDVKNKLLKPAKIQVKDLISNLNSIQGMFSKKFKKSKVFKDNKNPIKYQYFGKNMGDLPESREECLARSLIARQENLLPKIQAEKPELNSNNCMASGFLTKFKRSEKLTESIFGDKVNLIQTQKLQESKRLARNPYSFYKKKEKDVIVLPQSSSLEYKTPINLKNSKSNTKRIRKYLREDHPAISLDGQNMNQRQKSKLVINDNNELVIQQVDHSLDKFVNKSIQGLSNKFPCTFSQNQSSTDLNPHKGIEKGFKPKEIEDQMNKSEIAHNSALFLSKYLKSIHNNPIKKRNNDALNKSCTNNPDSSYSMLNRSVPMKERYLVNMNRGEYSSPIMLENQQFNHKARKSSGYSNVSGITGAVHPLKPSYDWIKDKYKNEYYKRRIFDKDLLQDSIQVLKDQKNDMKYFRNKLEIQHYFQTVKDLNKRRKKYNELLLVFHPDKRQKDCDQELYNKMFLFLQRGKKQFLKEYVSKEEQESKNKNKHKKCVSGTTQISSSNPGSSNLTSIGQKNQTNPDSLIDDEYLHKVEERLHERRGVINKIE